VLGNTVVKMKRSRLILRHSCLVQNIEFKTLCSICVSYLTQDTENNLYANVCALYDKYYKIKSLIPLLVLFSSFFVLEGVSVYIF
jgi:hypothetical protein